MSEVKVLILKGLWESVLKEQKRQRGKSTEERKEEKNVEKRKKEKLVSGEELDSAAV